MSHDVVQQGCYNGLEHSSNMAGHGAGMAF